MGTFLLRLFFLALTAFFSGSEIAFVSANKLAIEIKKSRGSSSGKILSIFFDNADEFISVMMVGLNISLVTLSYLLTDFFTSTLHFLPVREGVLILLNTFLVTLVILVFGEFFPKALFRLYANDILIPLAYPLNINYKNIYII